MGVGGSEAPPTAQVESMHKELVGQEASLRLPCNIDVIALLLGFIEELMEVSDSETHEPEALEGELKAAVAAVCGEAAADGAEPSCHLAATMTIRDDHVEVHLACEEAGPSAVDDVRVVRAGEA